MNPFELSTPLSVYPYGLKNVMNAYYKAVDKSLYFGYFTSPNPKDNGAVVYTCRSLDIVSHETGHAILDGFKKVHFFT